MCLAAIPAVAAAFPAMAAAAPSLTTIASVVGTGMSVIGSLQQGQAAKAQANYQAQVSRNNAKIAEWQAQDAEQRGLEQEREHRRNVQRLMGSQQAAIGGSGFEIGDITSQDLLSDTAMMGEADAWTIKNNAAREAWGYRVQGSNFSTEAEMNKVAGKRAARAGIMQAGTDLLSGASRFAGKI